MVKTAFAFTVRLVWRFVAIETGQLFNHLFFQGRLLLALQGQVVLGCLEGKPRTFIRHIGCLIRDLPVGADRHGMALVTTAWRRYALPGAEHGASGHVHEKPKGDDDNEIFQDAAPRWRDVP